MSESRLTSETASKGLLGKLWLFVKALCLLIFAYFVMGVCRLLIGAIFILLSPALALFIFFFGTHQTGRVLEMLSQSLRKYSI